MNLTALAQFIPLILALGLAYLLVMKQQLPSKGIGQILSYFLGIIIVFVAIRWLINSFFAQWANSILQDARASTELDDLIDTSENIFSEAFQSNGDGGNTQAPINNTINNNNGNSGDIFPAPTTPAGMARPEGANGSVQHTVATGDTLIGIADTYGSNVDNIMRVNNLTSYIIHPGDVLIIPAGTGK